MTELVKKFLEKIDEIKALKPTYKQPGDGSDGTCDCIGLIIGAIRRMGLTWSGIHGSNYAARKVVVDLKRIPINPQLEVGDIVFKALEPGEKKYDLPDRYKKGGAYYNGDLRDYYHVGVVTQADPLRITHMTTPSVKVDTKLGKWAYVGKLKQLQGSTKPAEPAKPSETTEPHTGTYENPQIQTATVIAPSGRTVNLRSKPSTKNGVVLVRVPIGTVLTVTSNKNGWAYVRYGKRMGYMMANYLSFE